MSGLLLGARLGLGLGFGKGGVVVGGGGGGPSAFLTAAQRIVAMSQNKRVITDAAPGDVTITMYTTPSVITGKTFGNAADVSVNSIPVGNAVPLRPGEKWIVSKTPANQTAANLTYGPGENLLFKRTCQRVEMRCSTASGTTFTVRWSEDNGLTWKDSGLQTLTANMWVLLDFGSVKSRVIQIIGEDQLVQITGMNFDDGTAAPAALDVSAFPKGMCFGDSYMYGQGASKTSKGIGQVCAEAIGWPQYYAHGFRTNGFSNVHLDGNGDPIQSRFADRIKLPTDDSLSEGSHYGAMDYVTMNASINDDGATWAPTRLQDHIDAFANMRLKQPNALIVFAIGLRPPDYGAIAYTEQKAGFKAVFGNTPAEWIANGAWMIDGSATGEAWITPGAVGSSPYYPATGDTAHPNDAGHALLGNKFAQAILSLATAIAGSVVTPTDSLRVTSTGDTRITADGNTRKVA